MSRMPYPKCRAFGHAWRSLQWTFPIIELADGSEAEATTIVEAMVTCDDCTSDRRTWFAVDPVTSYLGDRVGRHLYRYPPDWHSDGEPTSRHDALALLFSDKQRRRRVRSVS